MPWKNGGGETVEILVHPPDAGLDAFDWRISMACVAVDGPFSAFPGVDRTLTVLDGDGLVLEIAGRAPVHLAPGSAPFAFPADAPCLGRLSGGPVRDLNVMTRRGVHAHGVAAVPIRDRARVAAEGNVMVVIGRHGALSWTGADGASGTLDPGDALVLEDGEAVDLSPRDNSAAVLLVTVRSLAGESGSGGGG